MAEKEAGGRGRSQASDVDFEQGINPGPAETEGRGDSWETDLGSGHPWGKLTEEPKSVLGLLAIAGTW